MKGSKVIIRKVIKRGHGGGHGGSWKVAYADFVTAMMAFFLLLWLLSMVSAEKRMQLSHYFKFFSLFDKSGASVMEKGVELLKEGGGESPKLDDKGTEMEIRGRGPMELLNAKEGMTKEEFMEKLKNDIENRLADVKDQVMVEIFEGGVRIQLVDKDGGKSMFSLGSSAPTPDAKKILKVIAENMKDVNNFVSIEGHTDALSYSSSKYTNWELSTDRASAARKELENNKLDPDRLTRVAGYAATDPLIKDNPKDPRNRRISIMLIYPKGEDGSDAGVNSLNPVSNPPKTPEK